MPVEALLIQRPATDFTTFLGLSHQALGYSPASAADASRRKLSDAERFLSCLAALRDRSAPVGLPPKLLTHVSFSVLVIADAADMVDILENASGMPFVRAETVVRDIDLAVITGTLSQWRDAVTSGATPHVEPMVRECFCKIMALFEREGLNQVWVDFNKRPAPDKTGFYLEDRRK